VKLKYLDTLALILLIIGGLNWGFFGFLNFDLVAYLLGERTLASQLVYGLVVLSAVFKFCRLVMCGNSCRRR